MMQMESAIVYQDLGTKQQCQNAITQNRYTKTTTPTRKTQLQKSVVFQLLVFCQWHSDQILFGAMGFCSGINQSFEIWTFGH